MGARGGSHGPSTRNGSRKTHTRTTKERGYDGDWKRLRDAFLAANPLCCACAEEQRITAATVVDHIVSITDDRTRRLDWSNLRSMCKPHHDQRTAREQGFARSCKPAPRPTGRDGTPAGW